MKIARAIAQTSAGIWLGAIVMMAIVAPTTFSVMRTVNVDRPNEIAGKVMAKNFSRFDKVQIACAAVIIAWQCASLSMGRRKTRDKVRTGMIVAAAVLMLYSAMVMTPKIANMQSDIAAPDTEAAVKAAFDAFHATAVRITQAVMVLVLILNIEMAMPQHERRSPESAQ